MSEINQPAKERAQWNTRFGFILAAAGSAVGLGNIWKFPYITGENGGGWFVLIYLVCIALVGLPIMMARNHDRPCCSKAADYRIRKVARKENTVGSRGLAGSDLRIYHSLVLHRRRRLVDGLHLEVCGQFHR